MRNAVILGQRYKEMKKVDDLHPGVLFVDFLVLGPPLPRKAVDQLGNFLGHGPGVVERPLGFVLGRAYLLPDERDSLSCSEITRQGERK